MKNGMFLLALILFACAFNARAEQNYDGIPDSFIAGIKANDFEAAFNNLSRNVKDGKADQFKASFILASKSWGSYAYNELYRTEAFGTRLVRLTYIIGMSSGPVVLTMTVYKADQHWDVRSFNITSSIDDLMKQSANAQ